MTNDEQHARYQREKRQAIEILERAVGKDATIPLEMAAAVLPVLPEWQAWQRPLRRTRRPR